ncbi:MAG: ribosomal protein [Candidatus Saccharibacteria bacterium]|nr:ribosomal protein [Candidatus Saccharibacteria bacterium]
MSQDKIELTLEARSVTGKAVKHLRTEGVIPAVIHDHGKDSILVQGDRRVVLKAYLQAGKHHPISLKAGGKNYVALIKTIDFEPKKHTLRHVVFGAVKANEKVEAEIPVHAAYAEGNDASPAERSGFLVISNVSTVVVEATATNLPDELTYDAEKLVEVGDHITVAELNIPDGVELKTEPETVIATVYEPSAVAAANDAAGGDVEEVEAAEVPSDNGSPEDDKDSQAAENQPGGKAGSQSHGE